MKLLKLCNIKNIFETRTAGALRVSFLGYHLISENDFQRFKEIKKCVKELREYYPNTKSILVTKEQDVEKLIDIINEIEFSGVQLHYPDSEKISSKLKTVFGKDFIVIQVVSPESKNFDLEYSDYVILDKSYLGGTGQSIPLDEVSDKLDNIKGKNILLAGGISPANIYQYINLPVAGFDVQSAIKSDSNNKTENSDYLKMTSIAGLLGYKNINRGGLVGFAVQDINQENQELYLEAFDNQVDFFHVDISDGFVGEKTDVGQLKRLIDSIRKINTHMMNQLHFFVESQSKYEELESQLSLKDYSNLEIYIHINRDNYSNFESGFLNGENVYFGLDVKDIVDELFPWEQFIKRNLLICMQSSNHEDRIQNLKSALKLVRYSTKNQPVITLDRSIDDKVVTSLEDCKLTNIVCGTYLRENIASRYPLIKDLINVKN